MIIHTEDTVEARQRQAVWQTWCLHSADAILLALLLRACTCHCPSCYDPATDACTCPHCGTCHPVGVRRKKRVLADA